MVKIKVSGDYSKTLKYLKKLGEKRQRATLEKYGKMGVEALKEATPRRTGKTAESWDYEIKMADGRYEIVWFNTNENHGISIAMLIQNGHGTRSGYFVQGVDYINPAMKKVFDEIGEDAWKEITGI